MYRRRRHGVALVAVTVALAAVAAWFGTRPRVRLEDMQQVREGMTRAEVEATVGRPPGHYGKQRTAYLYPHYTKQGCATWVTEEAVLVVRFEGELATYVHVGEVRREYVPAGLLQRWRRLLGL